MDYILYHRTRVLSIKNVRFLARFFPNLPCKWMKIAFQVPSPWDAPMRQILIWRWDRLNFKRLLLGARPAARARCAALVFIFWHAPKNEPKKRGKGASPLTSPRRKRRNGSARSIPNALRTFGTRASKALSCKRLRRVRISRREPRWVLPACDWQASAYAPKMDGVSCKFLCGRRVGCGAREPREL